MIALFGTEGELLELIIGMLISDEAGEFMEDAGFLLVPDLSAGSIEKWRQKGTQDYRSKILREDKGMQVHPRGHTDVGFTKMRYSEIDGKKVEFSSFCHPRAEYPYLLYCSAILASS